MPHDVDCNSPVHWDTGTLHVFNSVGHPFRSTGSCLTNLGPSHRVEFNNEVNGGRWIECTWKADDGTLYGWYHNEPGGLCPGKGLTAPKIGALRSTDNGAHWQDLGIVLEAPAGTLRCDTTNFYFAGGHGDFCIMLDARREWLYFFISTYVGQVSEQGIGLARMRWADRDAPVGRARKWFNGGWTEPGLGGRVTPIFAASRDWHRADADALWGPSVHWNTHLRCHVMLLNRAVDKDWRQEGIYVSFSRDLADPNGWSQPARILGGLGKDDWYPQVMGLEREGTDKIAGEIARLFVRGRSEWELIFAQPREAD
jgi:hypothetical protein